MQSHREPTFFVSTADYVTKRELANKPTIMAVHLIYIQFLELFFDFRNSFHSSCA